MSFPALNHVLLVDDDRDFAAALSERLRLESLAVTVHHSAASALKAASPDFEGVVVTDLRMPGMDGRQLVERLQAIDPDLPVVMMTGHGDIAEAVEAMRRGAYDFLAKPFPPERLISTLRRALEKRALVLDNRRLSALAADAQWAAPLTGESRAMESLRAAILQLADAQVDVLIEGRTGTGKEAVARAIHNAGSRRLKRFTPVNCGALNEATLETHLMGHEIGAFPGAIRRRAGLIEQSHQGSLFLDEIEAAPQAAQMLLLRVLEEREILPLGAAEPQGLDLRVLAAAKGDLAEAVAGGDVRSDLYYRLNVVRLQVPALVERREDIPLLFAQFLGRAADRMGREPPALTHAVRRRLLEHDWPGNLRELANFAQRTVMGMEEPSPAGGEPGGTLADRVQRYEAELLREALTACRGDMPRACAALGVPRKTLYDKLARHGIRPADHRGS